MKPEERHGLKILSFVLISLVFPSNGLAQEPDALLQSVMRNDIEAVRELLATGADIDQRNTYGHTPLIIALNYDYPELARLLISEGADINIRGEDGATALIAAAGNSQELTELLLSKGADVQARMANGTGAFTQCINGILMERVPLALAETLLLHGADVDESPTAGEIQGYTPLMTAARNNHEALVRFLIEKGADVSAQAADGSTPLSLATGRGHQNIVDILKAAGGS
jgi:ankyrin repeat protein